MKKSGSNIQDLNMERTSPQVTPETPHGHLASTHLIAQPTAAVKGKSGVLNAAQTYGQQQAANRTLPHCTAWFKTKQMDTLSLIHLAFLNSAKVFSPHGKGKKGHLSVTTNV